MRVALVVAVFFALGSQLLAEAQRRQPDVWLADRAVSNVYHFPIFDALQHDAPHFHLFSTPARDINANRRARASSGGPHSRPMRPPRNPLRPSLGRTHADGVTLTHRGGLTAGVGGLGATAATPDPAPAQLDAAAGRRV